MYPRSLTIIILTRLWQKTSRTVDEIQADYAKIPIRPEGPVIHVSDDAENELGQIIDQMLIDAIALPPQNARPSSPPANSEHFYTPEQSPVPPHHNASNAAADTSRAETNSNTPCPVFCHCGVQDPEGDDDPDEVQCEKCKYWSHFRCYPGVDWNDPQNRFICRRCRVELDAEL
jgi:hypothetical protein